MTWADHEKTTAHIRGAYEMHRKFEAVLKLDAERRSLGERLARRIRQQNGVTVWHKTAEELAFAKRVDITYWPQRDEIEIHWHRDEAGDTPAVSLRDERISLNSGEK